MEGKGYPFSKLIDELIEIALETHKEKNKNVYHMMLIYLAESNMEVKLKIERRECKIFYILHFLING